MDSNVVFAVLFFCYLIITLVLSILFVIWFIKFRKISKKFKGVLDAESEELRIVQRTNDAIYGQKEKLLKNQELLREAENVYSIKLNQIQEVQELLVPLEDALDLNELGFFEPKFQLDDHAAYVFEVKKIREIQKDLVRSKRAAICNKEWKVGDSRAEGKKMVTRATRMTLRAFNNECDVLITKVNWKNIRQVKDRITRARDALNKLNESLLLEITNEYLVQKLKEAELVNEEKLKKEEEKERLRAQRELDREEAKAQREIKAEMKRQEAYELEKTNAMRKLKQQIATASPEHREALERDVKQIEEELAEAILQKGRLLSMAEQTRIGHIYVISNKGAFGERLVKIGMTRRIEPMDRVKELGDASVPFPFDVHAMVFSEDAPKLEKELHTFFDSYRSNKVNLRKEFFEVPLIEVRDELESRIPGVPFELDTPSLEFTASQPPSKLDHSPISLN